MYFTKDLLKIKHDIINSVKHFAITNFHNIWKFSIFLFATDFKNILLYSKNGNTVKRIVTNFFHSLTDIYRKFKKKNILCPMC